MTVWWYKMKSRKWLYGILCGVVLLLLGSSIYINFVTKNSNYLTYLLIGQMFVGIIGFLSILFLGLDGLEHKKSYELLFIGLLELLFVLGLVILNYVCGYASVVNKYDYTDYMGFVSMEFNIYLYIILLVVIGMLNINLYITEKFKNRKSMETIEEK